MLGSQRKNLGSQRKNLTNSMGHKSSRSALIHAAVLTTVFTLNGCSGSTSVDSTPQALRIYHDPYGQVAWSTDLRLKAQHHDHTAVNLDLLGAYDRAGYDVVPLMNYSGNPTLAYAMKTRLWPPESVLPADFLAGVQNIKIWLPNAEEVGDLNNHITSPFLTTYVELWLASASTAKRASQYESATELVAKIREFGGRPTLAHPWAGHSVELGVSCGTVEMYSAFAEAKRRGGDPSYVNRDHNAALLDYWDRALQIDQSVIGVAVNDHFGPLPAVPTDAEVADSGKIIVFARAATLDAYREAFDRGAVLAVRDMGAIKDRYPRIESISVESTSVLIDSPDTVRWIANGSPIASGSLLQYSALPANTRYVRAEISNPQGSVVYTQAFAVRPVGDSNGDGAVDATDRAVCDAVSAGSETHPDRVAACRS